MEPLNVIEHASANLYSLIETAKGHGLEPSTYLRYICKELPLAETVDDIDAFLVPADTAVEVEWSQCHI